jgi:ABC-type Co2+ transport system permease subunit
MSTASIFDMSIDASEILVRLGKYFFEGLVLSLAAYFLPGHQLSWQQIVLLGLVAAATFAVLDLFAPAIGSSVRSGAGYGIGFNLVGFPGAPITKFV